MFWFDKKNPDVLFGDQRNERHTLCDGRSLVIEPDLLLDFTDLPFSDGKFHLVVFDPPHLNVVGHKGWQGLKYGKLPEDWKDQLSRGFAECFRVLAENGTLIFKWNETQIKLSEILPLTSVKPLFGHTTTHSLKTHWVTFMKPKLS